MKGKGSIQKKGKIYYAVIALKDGTRKWCRGGPAQKDAQKVLIEKLAEYKANTYKELPKITFEQFTEIWLRDYVEISLKPSTKKLFKDVIQKLLLPKFSNTQISDIGTGELQAFVLDRAKTVKPNAVRNKVTMIRLIFKYARKWEYIKHNPPIDIERPKIEKPEIEILSPDEFKKLLEKSEKPYSVAFLTAFLTAMRAGELWGLQWGDIYWNSKQIHVKRSLWNHEFQKPKTKNAIRKIDMTESLIKELRAWKLACPVSEHNLVSPSSEGCATMHTNVMKRFFYPALRRAGLPQVSFHSLRHINASYRIHGGQNIKYIQCQLGHASINMTMDVYGHLFNDLDFNRKQVERLESVRKPLETQAKDESGSLVNTFPINTLQVVANA